MIFTLQGVYDISLTQENLPTKTLNPKVSSFAIQVSLSQALSKKLK